MTNNVYRSMQGKTIELDKLVMRNETTLAVGNARVNARGDELGPGGKIISKSIDVAPVRADSAVERPAKPVAKPVEQVDTTNTVEATPAKQPTKPVAKQVKATVTETTTAKSTEE